MRRRTFDVLVSAAFVMAILSVLGFWHLRRTSPETELPGEGKGK